MTIPEDVGIQRQLTELHVQEWLSDDVFRPQWWLLIALVAISVTAWCILIKKSRLLEICLYTALAVIVFLGINEYGEELCLWDYPTDIIPIFPPLSSVNMFIVPLIFSLIYQFYTARKPFIIASAAAACVLSMVIDPLLSFIRLYELINWNYYESIPVYFLAAVTVRAAVIKIYKILEAHRVNI
jgi:hypothetical protein